MVKKIIILTFFIVTLSACGSDVSKNTLEDFRTIKVNDNLQYVEDKLGKPNDTLIKEDAHDDLNKERNLLSSLNTDDEVIAELIRMADKANENNALEVWKYSYKDDDKKDREYSIYTDSLKVIYTSNSDNVK